MAKRKPIIAGNWKMNCNHLEAVDLINKLRWKLTDYEYDPARVECALIVPYTDIRTVQTLVESDKLPFTFGAQNVSSHKNGAYTGEISVDMLSKLRCTYVVLGHSERRQYHRETDVIVNQKAQRVFDEGMIPIVCVGERLDVRKAGRQVPFVLEQLRWCLSDLSASQVASMVIAYEPVWAIGTGEVATPLDAQQVCNGIRRYVEELLGSAAAEQVRIQYGGSVKASNVAEIMAQPDIDGALVGGASLNPEEFARIVTYYKRS